MFGDLVSWLDIFILDFPPFLTNLVGTNFERPSSFISFFDKLSAGDVRAYRGRSSNGSTLGRCVISTDRNGMIRNINSMEHVDMGQAQTRAAMGNHTHGQQMDRHMHGHQWEQHIQLKQKTTAIS